MSDELLKRLGAHIGSDHERGCQGRCYSCSCGWDDARESLVVEAAARVRELEDERDSWAQQADDRCKDAVEAIQRAESAEASERPLLQMRDELLAENERLRGLLREAEPYARVERWGKPGCDLADRIRAALAGEKP